nr:molybdate ABC transporter substrate-binding protein [Iodidimonas nitroreducens]
MPNFCCLSHYHPLPAFRAAVLRLMVVAVLSLAFYGLAAAQDRSPVIAAASDLRFALSDIITTFEKDTGHKVRVSYGSTGQFAQQIRQGAPYQIFMAADEAYIADLHRLGLTMDEGDLYAEGRIVLMVPHGSKLKTDAHLDHLASLLDEKAIAHFAIANPDHAPYGARAKEA